jgi:hypothetical protein
MRGFKSLLCAAALLLPLALAPKANAQISVTIGGPPPVCPYGYYGYAPYACAPAGYYGPGYFYNGIFLGVGPWAYWGYRHGWGGHRYRGPGGGRYHYGPAYRYRGGSYHGGGRPGGGGSYHGNGRPSGGGRPSGNGRPSGGGSYHGGGGGRPH